MRIKLILLSAALLLCGLAAAGPLSRPAAATTTCTTTCSPTNPTCCLICCVSEQGTVCHRTVCA
jgi:hypothetical protein